MDRERGRERKRERERETDRQTETDRQRTNVILKGQMTERKSEIKRDF